MLTGSREVFETLHRLIGNKRGENMFRGSLFLLSVWAYLFCSGAVFAEPHPGTKNHLIADESIIYQVDNPEKGRLFNPAIAVTPTGRIVICFETFRVNTPADLTVGSGATQIYTSDDGGETWDYRANCELLQNRFFIVGDTIYSIGHDRGGRKGHFGDLAILKSEDNGETWSDHVLLDENRGLWHSCSQNVIVKENFVYLVMERRGDERVKTGWNVSEMAPVMLRGDFSKGLMHPSAWTLASSLPFYEAVEDKELDYFGIPMYAGYFPNSIMLQKSHKKYGFPPCGWCEFNIVQITDPTHQWYDPSGKTFHLFGRAHTGRSNFAAVMKAVEQEDGSIKTMFQRAPSGKKHVYSPLPGGQMKYFVLYDDKTELYWLLSTLAVDTMCRPECLPDERYGLADNERRRLQLSFSKNMVDWCFAGLVAMGDSERESRHYASMDFDGEDLVILSRSGSAEAHSAHDGNMITFHRVQNFRNLVY
jgi:hypothetical protein